MKFVPCNLCGADDWRLRLPATAGPRDDGRLDAQAYRCTNADYGRHPQIVECRQCGYVYANPRPDDDVLLEAYGAVEDDIYVRERAARQLTFRRHLAALEKHVGPAQGRSLLDVGAYIGVFVEVAAAAGWDACGVEPSAWAVGVAREQGLDVLAGTLEAPALDGRAFDVITMWDVIEHVADPRGELTHAFHHLKPGGVIAVHTMDIDSHLARLMGPRWPWLMEMHIHYFSQRTLAEMLRAVGYEVVWSGTQGRLLRLGYLASRVGGLSPSLGRLTGGVVRRLGLAEKAVPVNFGDLFTIYARRPPMRQ